MIRQASPFLLKFHCSNPKWYSRVYMVSMYLYDLICEKHTAAVGDLAVLILLFLAQRSRFTSC